MKSSNLKIKITYGENLKFHHSQKYNKIIVMENKSYKLSLYSESNVFIGHIGLEVYEEDDKKFGYVFCLVLNPDWRGLGLGTFLMRKLENFAKSLNIDELLLRPATDKIVNFYKKLNYKYKNTEEEDSIIMEKELKENKLFSCIFKEANKQRLRAKLHTHQTSYNIYLLQLNLPYQPLGPLVYYYLYQL